MPSHPDQLEGFKPGAGLRLQAGGIHLLGSHSAQPVTSVWEFARATEENIGATNGFGDAFEEESRSAFPKYA